MSSATHPQFPSTGIPQMGDIVTMEITYWPCGQDGTVMRRTEKAFVIYQDAVADDECYIHLLNPYPGNRTLEKKEGSWNCQWLGDTKHQVAVSWKPVVHFQQPR
jgi:hypothetical protein